ncbi:MAG TPA: 4'-phosphopantetheinyl transferase superfamily protein, partial [Microthrixaceae bacterium]|nr:4'-phosphopantetheinyl transferase superfamily protein [Microthrixaceae bacterium]
EIGVDIERADRRTVEPERFARRVLSVAERAAIEGLGGDALDRALIRMWTRKEAVLKAAGHGLRRELADIDTVADVVMLDGSPWNCWTTNWRDLVMSVAWGQLPTR